MGLAAKVRKMFAKAGTDAGSDVSFEDRTRAVSQAFRNALRNAGEDAWDSWTVETYDEYVIVCQGDDYLRIPYSVNTNPLGDKDGDADDIVFDWANSQDVEQVWQPVTGGADAEGEAGDMQAVNLSAEIRKVDEARHLVFGWANVATAKDGTAIVDSQGDEIPVATLEDAAYVFALMFREADDTHTAPVVGQLVESMVFTHEKMAALVTDAVSGEVDAEAFEALKAHLPQGWWTGFYVPGEQFERCKRAWEATGPDDLAMLSIGGISTKREATSDAA